MRIAVSDYDGTLRRDRRVSDDDLAAIADWRRAGHQFGLATGRDLGMTVHELDLWHIEVDFLVCCNGAGLYDGKRSLLRGSWLENDLVAALLTHPAAAASLHCQLSGDGPMLLYMRDGKSWIPRLGLPYTEVSFEEALAARDLRQISLAYDTAAESADWTARLRDDLGHRVAPHQNTVCIDVTPAGCDKAEGIAQLAEMMDWDTGEILVIGDGQNDRGMLRRFRGHTVPEAAEEIRSIAGRVVDSVGAMLRENV